MRLLITGTLHEDPAHRTSGTGKAFVVAKLKDDTTNPATWVSLVAFDNQAETLAKLKKGAALAVSGKATVGVYAPATGDPRANINVTVDQLATLKRIKP